MKDSEILGIINGISSPHGLRASFLGDESTMSVGVGGDNRSYTRVIVLEGLFPDYETLAKISTQISNSTGINRVTFNLTPLADGASNF